MKNLKYLIIGLLIVSSFVACDDEDFLTEKPKTIYTPTTAFEKSSQVEAQLTTAYRATFNMYGGYYMFWTTQTTQQLLHGQGADFFDNAHIGASGDGSGSAYSDFAKWSPTDAKFNNLWNEMYKLISYANLTIYGADQVDWTDEYEKAYNVAQAKFFRGYAYLRLAECFGGVPIVDEFTETLKLDYVRDTRENTYNFAIADLEDAAAGLPAYPAQDGRVAQGAANHFLAEAYLALGVETGEAGNYTKAISAATKTIDLHPLMTERFGSRANPADLSTNNGIPAYKPEGNVFYDLFQVGNYDYSEGNTEAVWTMEAATYDQAQSAGLSGSMYGFGGQAPYYSLTGYVGPVFRNMVWIPELQEEGASSSPFDGNIDQSVYPGGNTCAYLGGMTMGGTAETKYVSEKVWADEYADDMRNDPINICRDFICLDRNHSRYGTVVKPEEIIFPRMLFPVRAKIAMQDDWGWHSSQVAGFHQQQFGRDWNAVRSAETYLLRAEAYMRSGQNSMAAADIKTVRDRAQASKVITAGEIDIYTILDERARELAYEEHRWPTLLRMGSSVDGSNEVMISQLMNNAMFVADVPFFNGTINWTLFPIPQTVIQVNTGAVLEQNPGWN